MLILLLFKVAEYVLFDLSFKLNTLNFVLHTYSLCKVVSKIPKVPLGQFIQSSAVYAALRRTFGCDWI